MKPKLIKTRYFVAVAVYQLGTEQYTDDKIEFFDVYYNKTSKRYNTPKAMITADTVNITDFFHFDNQNWFEFTGLVTVCQHTLVCRE